MRTLESTVSLLDKSHSLKTVSEDWCAGYCSDHRAGTLSLVRHDGDDLTLTPSELDGRATSALELPDTHDVRRFLRATCFVHISARFFAGLAGRVDRDAIAAGVRGGVPRRGCLSRR